MKKKTRKKGLADCFGHCELGQAECRTLNRPHQQWSGRRVNQTGLTMLRCRATCPEHRAAVKLHAWVFEVVALASHEDEDERCDK